MITFRPQTWPKHYGPRNDKTVYTSKPKGDRKCSNG